MRSWIVGASFPSIGGAMAFPAERSRSLVIWRAFGLVKRRNPSPTPMSTFRTAALLSDGSRIHWIWSAASPFRGLGAEMSSRTRVSPCFQVRHLGKGTHPFFRENNVTTVTFFQTHCNNKSRRSYALPGQKLHSVLKSSSECDLSN